MPIPAISCLIPIYNGERYMALALDSILGQTYQDFEVICIDDGSRDGTASVLDDYSRRDARIKVFSKQNGGIVSALNFGLSKCSGHYIARMDADDISTPDRFMKQIETFEKNMDAVAVGGLIVGIDEHGKITGGPTSPSRVSVTDVSTFPPKVANVQHSAGMFLASALKEIGGYRSTFRHAEDYDLYLRLSSHGIFINPPTTVLYYRHHANAVSIQNLVEQETNAVMAEMSAIARHRNLPDPGDIMPPLDLEGYYNFMGTRLFPPTTIQRYIDFRLWRRLWNRQTDQSLRYRALVIQKLMHPSSYIRRDDVKLTVRVLLSVLRNRMRGRR